MRRVQVPDSNESVIEIEIHQRDWFFIFSWNSEGGFWTLSIENSEQNTIVNGIVITINNNLLHHFKHLEIPEIGIYCLGKHEPKRDSFITDSCQIIIDD